MPRPTCSTCPYWGPFEPDKPDVPGECRRMPPTVPMTEALVGYFARDDDPAAGVFVAVWPQSDPDEWCGEHPGFPAYLAGIDPLARIPSRA